MKKKVYIQIQADDFDKTMLESLARDADQSMSAYIRTMIRRDYKAMLKRIHREKVG